MTSARWQTRRLEAMGLLTRAAAHDFNNLLSIILGYGEMMEIALEHDDPRRTDLEEINLAATRAVNLNRQLLAFSHQEVCAPEALDLNGVIAGMEQLLRHVMGEQVEIELLLAPTLEKLMADPAELEHILLHLVMNARDRMPNGGKLTVESANIEEGEADELGQRAGRRVMLTVGDTGTAVDVSSEKRLSVSLSRSGDRSEGLSTVSRIVEECAGTIGVSCDPGKGTVFRMLFPVAQTNREVSSLPVDWRGALGGSETVLVVEDNEQVRVMVVKNLRDLGYRVLEAQSAGDALIVCEQHEGAIDLLLSDVVMPRLSGPDLARRLETSRPAMRAIFMSGYSEAETHGIQASSRKLLRKPFTPKRLAQHVREGLCNSNADDDLVHQGGRHSSATPTRDSER